MKTITLKALTLFLVAAFFFNAAMAQTVKEVTQPLSKKSSKGFVNTVQKQDDGSIKVTYKIPGDKKSDQASFEEYSFDRDLKFLDDKVIEVPKEPHADYEAAVNYVEVGGCSSFDILSMKLKLCKVKVLKTWSSVRNRYVVKKVTSREVVKAKSEDGSRYVGYASYNSSDDAKNNVLVVAKSNSKDKALAGKFLLLNLNEQFDIKEIPVELNGNYSLVFTDQFDNDNIMMVFAPDKGAADLTKYVYVEYDMDGNLKNRIEFNSPASAMLITACYEKSGNVYLCGSSVKSTDPFAKVFDEYASIENPCYPGGANAQDERWEKAAGKKMDNFHLLKFSGNQLVFANTTPVSEFKKKVKVAPGEKGADPYTGKKFTIQQFAVTANDEYLIAGQLTGRVVMTGSSAKTYEDLVCLLFDKTGTLVAQYGVEKMNNDKKSEIFDMSQSFYLSADGKSVCWEINEVKGFKGYANFSDALNGVATFYPMFYPRIGTIDLTNASISAFKALGDGNYYLNKSHPGSYDSQTRTITYLGHDEDNKKLWIGQVAIP